MNWFEVNLGNEDGIINLTFCIEKLSFRCRVRAGGIEMIVQTYERRKENN